MNLSETMKVQSGKPIVLLLIYLSLFACSIFVLQFLLAILFTFFTPLDLHMLNRVVMAPNLYPEYKMHMLFIQGFTSFGSMVLLSFVYAKRYKTDIPIRYDSIPNEVIFLATGVLVILSMPTISWIADWNNSIIFPEYLKGFESWARAKEDQLKILTEYLTHFETPYQFVWGLLVIALIPALGEELMFRGVIQTLLIQATKNIHIAIWITGILFSAIHFQFFGFIPRALLGVFFGYLYIWSGSIWIPVCAHFVNNGFTLSMLYLKQLGYIRINIESSAELSGQMIFIALILFVVYFWVFRNQLISVKKSNQDAETPVD